MPPELNGPRLCLRPLHAGDEALYCAVYGDAELMRQIAAPLTAAAARRAFAAALRANAAGNPHTAYWVLFEREQRTDVGLLGLLGAPRGIDAEVGAMILPGCQGRGHAAEAIAELADFAFTQLPLMRLHTRHAAANGAAIGLMHKLGFVPIASDALGHRWELLRESWWRRR